MLIESSEQFQVSAALAIRRGPNQLSLAEFERLPVPTRTKLQILQQHGVLRVEPGFEIEPEPGSI